MYDSRDSAGPRPVHLLPRALLLVPLLALFPGCSEESGTTTPDASWSVIFTSGFEPEEGALQSDENWSNTQIQEPFGRPEAFVTFNSEIVRSGSRSLEMFAPQQEFDEVRDREFCGKASVQKTNFLFREGETYRWSAWFYLTDPPPGARFLMIDIECGESECGHEGGPGFRVMIEKGAPHMVAEWKFLNWFNDVVGPDPPPGTPVSGLHALPVAEWFQVTVEATLGVGDDGITRIYSESWTARSWARTSVPAGSCRTWTDTTASRSA